MSKDPAISIDVYSDVVCPWCYLGKRRLEHAVRAMKDTPVAIRWRPFQLDATIPEGGISRVEYVRNKFGSSEALKRIHGPLIAMGSEVGIEFHFELIKRSPNTLRAHRLIDFAREERADERLIEDLFALYFVEGADLGDRTILVDAAEKAGLSREDAMSALDSDHRGRSVETEIRAAVELGVTGVPTFVVDNRYAIVGAQESRYIAGAIARGRSDRVSPHPPA